MFLQLVYYSRFVAGSQGAMSAVRDILKVSEAKNGRNRVTGFLIFDKANFLQILEGMRPTSSEPMSGFAATRATRASRSLIVARWNCAHSETGPWEGIFVRRKHSIFTPNMVPKAALTYARSMQTKS